MSKQEIGDCSMGPDLLAITSKTLPVCSFHDGWTPWISEIPLNTDLNIHNLKYLIILYWILLGTVYPDAHLCHVIKSHSNTVMTVCLYRHIREFGQFSLFKMAQKTIISSDHVDILLNWFTGHKNLQNLLWKLSEDLKLDVRK